MRNQWVINAGDERGVEMVQGGVLYLWGHVPLGSPICRPVMGASKILRTPPAPLFFLSSCIPKSSNERRDTVFAMN